MVSEGRMDRQMPETPDQRDCQVIIRNSHIQHLIFRKFTTPAFIAKMMDDWHFNIDGGLPLHCGLEVLADGPHGPIMFQHHHSLHLAVAVNTAFACEPTKMIIREYITDTLRNIAENKLKQMGLYHFLYTVNGGNMTDRSKLSKQMASPLNGLTIRSAVPGGATRYVHKEDASFSEAPDPDVVIQRIIGNAAKGRTIPIPANPAHLTRNPCQSRQIRLRRVFKSCYGEESTGKFCAGIATSDTINIPVEESIHFQDTTAEQREALQEYQRAVSPPSRPHSSQRSSRKKLPVASLPDNLGDYYENDTSMQHFDGDEDFVLHASASGTVRRTQSARASSPSHSHHHSRANLTQGATSASRPHTASGEKSMSNSVSREEGMRINWDTNWEKVRYPPDPTPLVTTQKPPKLTLPVHKAVAASYLPIQHPRNASIQSARLHKETSAGNTTDGFPSTVRTEVVRPKSSKPYSTKAKFDEIVEKEKMTKEYLGVFRGGHLSAYDKERREYVSRKTRFIAGTFKTHHGKASEMPLRQDGGVRAHGAFPAPVEYHKENTYTLHGDWTPVTDLFPNPKERLSETIERTTYSKPTSRNYKPKKGPKLGVQRVKA